MAHMDTCPAVLLRRGRPSEGEHLDSQMGAENVLSECVACSLPVGAPGGGGGLPGGGGEYVWGGD